MVKTKTTVRAVGADDKPLSLIEIKALLRQERQKKFMVKHAPLVYVNGVRQELTDAQAEKAYRCMSFLMKNGPVEFCIDLNKRN